MKNISFQDSNLEEFTINGDPARVIRVDTSDVGIIERIGTAKRLIEEKMKELEGVTMDVPEGEMDDVEKEAVFDRYTALMADVNEFIRQQTNYIFNSDVADAAFGNQSPLTTVKGVSLFERFFNAILPAVEKAVKKEQEARQKRISKYTERYHK